MIFEERQLRLSFSNVLLWCSRLHRRRAIWFHHKSRSTRLIIFGSTAPFNISSPPRCCYFADCVVPTDPGSSTRPPSRRWPSPRRPSATRASLRKRLVTASSKRGCCRTGQVCSVFTVSRSDVSGGWGQGKLSMPPHISCFRSNGAKKEQPLFLTFKYQTIFFFKYYFHCLVKLSNSSGLSE